MPIVIDLSNLVLPKDTVAQYYEGGVEQFREDYINEDYPRNEEDDELFSLSKMNPDEFNLSKLMDKGFNYDTETQTSKHFVILQKYAGMLWEVDWLKLENWYFYHINCSQEQKDKVHHFMNEVLLDDIVAEAEAEGRDYLFPIIKTQH